MGAPTVLRHGWIQPRVRGSSSTARVQLSSPCSVSLLPGSAFAAASLKSQEGFRVSKVNNKGCLGSDTSFTVCLLVSAEMQPLLGWSLGCAHSTWLLGTGREGGFVD